MSGWVPQDASWWPVIAEALPRPWPREAVLADLRWWQDQERLGLSERPGRVDLARRWGWSDWPVRQVMKSEPEWCSPIHAPAIPTTRLPSTYHSPTTRLPPHNGHTPDIAPIPPADLPPASSPPTTSLPVCEKTNSEEQRSETRGRARTTRARGHTVEEQELLGTCRTLLQQVDPTQFALPDGQKTSICEAAIRGVTPEQATLVFDFFQKSNAGMAKIAKEGHWNRRWKPILNPDNFTAYLVEASEWAKRGRIDETSVGKRHPNEGRWDDIAAGRQATNGKIVIDVNQPDPMEHDNGVRNGSSELLQALARGFYPGRTGGG